MTTDVDICNNALSGIGTRSTIASLSEDSPEARACLQNYQQTVDELLRTHPWSFARFQVSPAVFAAAAGTPENPNGTGPLPPSPWLYSYAAPSDHVRTLRVLPAAGPGSAAAGALKLPFVVRPALDLAGNQITTVLTNQPLAQLIYIGRPPSPDDWDILFRSAVIAGLAAKLVLPLSGEKTLSRAAQGAAAQALDAARVADGNQGSQEPQPLPDWLEAGGFSGLY